MNDLKQQLIEGDPVGREPELDDFAGDVVGDEPARRALCDSGFRVQPPRPTRAGPRGATSPPQNDF